MKSAIILVSLVCSCAASAQELITEEFTALESPCYLMFQPIAASNKILASGLSEGLNIVYDKVWNELERHNAGQEDLITTNKSASRSWEYDSSKKVYSVTDWTTSEWESTTAKYSYAYAVNTDYVAFLQGTAGKFDLIRDVKEPFLDSHSVSTFGENFDGIAGQASNVRNSYTTLTTHFEIIDWDGNILATIIPPYYLRYASCQGLEVDDKTYLIASAQQIYPKTVTADCSLYSTEEYDLSTRQIQPECYHYFIYEYDKQSHLVKLIKTESVKANRKLVGIYDLNGNRLNDTQPGINILLYSDGTATKLRK